MKSDTPENQNHEFLDEITIRLRDKIFSELATMSDEQEDLAGSGEQRLKSLMGFFKIVQGVEEMVNRIKAKRDEESSRGVDVVEFRRQLEEQISRLVDEETAGVVS